MKTMGILDDRSYWKNKDTDRLFEAVLSLKTLPEAERFFRDLMTIPEIETFAERLKVAILLQEGVPYREIAKRSKASTATITRVNQWLTKGMDGYKLVLSRITSKIHHHRTVKAAL